MTRKEFTRRASQMASGPKPKKPKKFKYLDVCFSEHQLASLNTGSEPLNRQAAEALATEIAYDMYARGSGDNLGPATISYDEVASTYNLRYVWQDTVTVSNLPNNYRYIDSASTAASTIISNWLPETSDWIDWGTNQAFDTLETQIFAPALPAEKIQVINKKAAELLLQHLSPIQQQTWLAEAYFDILAPSGRRYRLTKGHFHNVFLLDKAGNRVREYCAYSADPGGKLPVEDNLFAQLLTLQFNEEEFLANANTWNLIGQRAFAGKGVDSLAGKQEAHDIIERGIALGAAA